MYKLQTIPTAAVCQRDFYNCFFTGQFGMMNFTGSTAATRFVSQTTGEPVTTTLVPSTACSQSSGPGPTAHPVPRNRQEKPKLHKKTLMRAHMYSLSELCMCPITCFQPTTSGAFTRTTPIFKLGCHFDQLRTCTVVKTICLRPNLPNFSNSPELIRVNVSRTTFFCDNTLN